MKVMVIGSGGREHAIAWKCAMNKQVQVVYCAPGNGGTAMEPKCQNVDLSTIEDLRSFALKNQVDLTVVGPEAYLVEGLVDSFREKGLHVFGPTSEVARLEGSKVFAKEFMNKYGVRTAECQVFQDAGKAASYLKNCSYPVVVKADGLAAGKGVVICQNEGDALKAVESMMVEGAFGGAGKTVVVEEFLQGVEASILCITDGKTIVPFISSKDHKTVYENDKGPNTGGMGVIAPNPYFTEERFEDFKENIMLPTLNGIRKEGFDYRGIVFLGVMITSKGCYLLEYNVRMGDPETQAVLPLMDSDLVELLEAAQNRQLEGFDLKWKSGASCCITGASQGYPGKYQCGYEITGLEKAQGKVFVAGAKFKDRKLVTAGGRVLNAVALGENIGEAKARAYMDMQSLNFQGMFYRKDIGNIQQNVVDRYNK